MNGLFLLLRSYNFSDVEAVEKSILEKNCTGRQTGLVNSY